MKKRLLLLSRLLIALFIYSQILEYSHEERSGGKYKNRQVEVDGEKNITDIIIMALDRVIQKQGQLE